MSESAPRRTTVDEFVRDHAEDARRELYEGLLVAVAPIELSHGALVDALRHRLSDRLAVQPINHRMWVGSGFRSRHWDNSFFRPDLAVSRGVATGPRLDRDALILVIEVLADSIDDAERLTKLMEYHVIPSMQEIVEIDSRRMLAQVHRRVSADRWMTDLLLTREARLKLDSVGLDIALGEIYAGLPTE